MRMSGKLLAGILILVCGLGALADERHAISFPDIPGYVTLKCDFHMHTVFSDGYVWPTVRVDEAWREGLDAIAITDHIEYRPHKEDVGNNLNRSYELMVDRAKQKDVLLIRGGEITHDTPPGHFNAIFLSDVMPLDSKDIYVQFDQAAAQNGFMFWNHPGWHGLERGQWGEEQARLFEKGQLKGIEICNETDYYPVHHQMAVDKKLTLLGDSDIHYASPPTPWTTEDHRTLTLVFAKERSLDAIHAALLDGRTAVWCKNWLYGREPELTQLFAAAVRVRPPHHRTEKDIWFRIDNDCDLDLELERTGKVGPEKLTLPARSGTLVRLRGVKELPADGLEYKVTNMLTAPDSPLAVRLVVPAQ